MLSVSDSSVRQGFVLMAYLRKRKNQKKEQENNICVFSDQNLTEVQEQCWRGSMTEVPSTLLGH